MIARVLPRRDPTPEEIERMTLQIRNNWTAKQRRHREPKPSPGGRLIRFRDIDLYQSVKARPFDSDNDD